MEMNMNRFLDPQDADVVVQRALYAVRPTCPSRECSITASRWSSHETGMPTHADGILGAARRV